MGVLKFEDDRVNRHDSWSPQSLTATAVLGHEHAAAPPRG